MAGTTIRLLTTTKHPPDIANIFDVMVNTTLSSSNITQTTQLEHDGFLKHEKMAEGMLLLFIAAAGLFLNALIIMFVLLCTSLRTYSNAFLVHSCALDAFKSALCIPFGLALLDVSEPTICNALGLAYVIALTVSMFNLLAMVMAAAYTFHEKNVDEPEDEGKSAMMCVLFGTLVIYIGSVILHLGPTLIGGELDFNEDIGNCIFAYGKVQNYIVQVIWIAIVTLTLTVIYRYIFKFYFYLKANQRFRITTLARNAVAYSKGKDPTSSIYSLVSHLKQRVRVLFYVTVVYTICWYPLFILTAYDIHYQKPVFIYRITTLIAWSHSALAPLLFLIFDRSISCKALRDSKRSGHRSSSTQAFLSSLSRGTSMTASPSDQSINRFANNAAKPNSIEEDGNYSECSPILDRRRIADYIIHSGNGSIDTRKSGTNGGPDFDFDFDALSLEESPC